MHSLKVSLSCLAAAALLAACGMEGDLAGTRVTYDGPDEPRADDVFDASELDRPLEDLDDGAEFPDGDVELPDPLDGFTPPEVDRFSDPTVTIMGASLHGAWGPVAVDHPVRRVRGGIDGGWFGNDSTTLSLHIDDIDGNAVMGQLVFDGMRLSDLQVGDRFESSWNDLMSDDPFVTFLACSGESPGDWDYDEDADPVIVEVDPAPEGSAPSARLLRFSGTTWSGDEVSGEVLYDCEAE